MKRKERNEFGERRKTAVEAKEKLLKHFAAAPKADDPAVMARIAERSARATERDARRAEQDRLRQEERDRQLSEAIALKEAAQAKAKSEAEARDAAEKTRAAAAEAAEEARVAADESRAAHTIADQLARKMERDRRYAARKARQS